MHCSNLGNEALAEAIADYEARLAGESPVVEEEEVEVA
jgi:hypothetical protein